MEVKYDCKPTNYGNIYFKVNQFFNEIEKIDHMIDVPQEYLDVFKGHVCRCGKLLFSSFLPNEIRNEYYQYINKKALNTLTEKNVKDIAETVNNEILKSLSNDGKNNLFKKIDLRF